MTPVTASRAAQPFLPNWVLVLLFITFVGLTFAVKSLVFPDRYRDVDVASYWAAARTAFLDEVSPYGAEAPRLAQQRWMPDRLEVPPFLYTPVALLAFGPLQWMEPFTAARALFGLNLLAAVVMMTFLVRTLGLGSSRRVAWASALYTLLFPPLYESIGAGQINLLLMLLVFGVWHVYGSRRSTVAGGLAAASVVFLKLHLGLLLLPVLLRQRVSLLLTFIASLVLGSGLAAAVFPFNAWGSWLEHVVRASSLVKLPEGLPSVAMMTNLSIPAMTARFLVPSRHRPFLDAPAWISSAVPALLCGLVLVWTAWVLWRSSRMPHTPERANAEVCLALAAAFELSPLSWTHHLVFVLPTMLLLLRHVVLEPGRPPLTRGVLAASMLILVPHPYLFGKANALVLVAMATLQSLAALAMWGAISVWVLQLAREPSPDIRKDGASEALVNVTPAPSGR